MIAKPMCSGFSLIVALIMINSIDVHTNAYAQDMEKSLEWKFEASKKAFYPGEPLLLILNIKSTATQEDEVDFGADGIEAFSLEMRDSNDNIVAKKGKIQRFGLTMKSPFAVISPNNICQKYIILNQWCSTLVVPDKYHVICNIEYRLRSESQKQPNTIVIKAGPIHRVRLGLDIRIVEMDRQKFKEMLEALFAFEVKPETQNKEEWLAKRDIARETLTFAESELAVPYQLQLLRVEQYTWRKRDIANSLVRSGALGAANGLMEMIEDPSLYKEDVRYCLIDAVYRLRDTGRPDLVNATEEFVAKHKRPVLDKSID